MRALASLALASVAAFSIGCAKGHAAESSGRAGPMPAGAAAVALRLRDEIPRTSRATELVRGLCDAAGPRLAGSPGAARAIAWAEATMRAAGLENVHAEPVTVPHWERIAEHGEVVLPHRRPLALTALGGSVPTPAGGIEADVVRVPSLAELERLPDAALSGKLAFLDAETPRRADGSGYGEAVWMRGRGVIEAARRGAIGVLIRSVGTDHDRLPHTGQLRYDDAVPKIPAAAVSVPDAARMRRWLEAREAVRARLELATARHPDAAGANVVGELRGSTSPGEIVLLGAHLDAWDLGDGALDDGAGCAIAIEAARQIAARPRPARTIRVVLFANEESGLAGAFAYAKAHEAELGAHTLAIEADSGDGRALGVRVLGGNDARDAFVAVARLLGPDAPLDAAHAEGGADLIPLRAAGVPVLDVEQDETRYFDVHHTANDTFEKIVPEELDRATAAFATIVYGAASVDGGFGRIPDERRRR